MSATRSLRLLALASAPILIGVAAMARADLEVALLNGDRVRGTIFPATEQETFAIVLPRGARLNATASPKRTGLRPRPPAMSLRLLDPLGRDVGDSAVKNKGQKGRVSKFVAPESGRYQIEVNGDRFAIGDYRLSVKWSSKKRYKWKGADTSQGIQDLDFAADTGAVAVIKAKAAKGSPALPVITDLVRVENGQETIVHTFDFPVRPEKVFAVKVGIATGGDHRLKLRDGGGFGGPVDVTLRLKAGGGRRDVKLTDDAIGVPPSDVRILETVLFDDDGGTSPDGTPSLTIPIDALTKLTPLQIGVGDAYPGPADSGLLPVGSTVFVGPPTLEFDRQVAVEVPFEPASFQGDTSSLRVVVRDETGFMTVLHTGFVAVDVGRRVVTAQVRTGGTIGVYRLVPPPQLASLAPFVGSTAGGYVMTMGGANFRDTRDTDDRRWLQVTMDGSPIDAQIVSVSPTQLSFIAPGHDPGRVTFGVLDRETGVLSELPTGSYEYR